MELKQEVDLGELLQETLDELRARTPGIGQTFEGAAKLRQLVEIDIPARLQAHLPVDDA